MSTCTCLTRQSYWVTGDWFYRAFQAFLERHGLDLDYKRMVSWIFTQDIKPDRLRFNRSPELDSFDWKTSPNDILSRVSN